jgi:hypothetical protein
MKARMLFGDEFGFPNSCLYTNPLGIRFAFRIGSYGIGIVLSIWKPYLSVRINEIAR